jgi:hypothetical protein
MFSAANSVRGLPAYRFTITDNRKNPELLYSHSLPGSKFRAFWFAMIASASSSVVTLSVLIPASSKSVR